MERVRPYKVYQLGTRWILSIYTYLVIAIVTQIILKGIVHPKCKFWINYSPPVVHLWNIKLRYFSSSFENKFRCRGTLDKLEDGNSGDKKLLNKVYLCFLVRIKSIKIKVDHWCHMDYFNNVLATLIIKYVDIICIIYSIIFYIKTYINK